MVSLVTRGYISSNAMFDQTAGVTLPGTSGQPATAASTDESTIVAQPSGSTPVLSASSDEINVYVDNDGAVTIKPGC